jgi:hypothetical protein
VGRHGALRQTTFVRLEKNDALLTVESALEVLLVKLLDLSNDVMEIQYQPFTIDIAHERLLLTHEALQEHRTELRRAGLKGLFYTPDLRVTWKVAVAPPSKGDYWTTDNTVSITGATRHASPTGSSRWAAWRTPGVNSSTCTTANQSPVAAQALEYIGGLYAIEREVRDLFPEERRAQRQPAQGRWPTNTTPGCSRSVPACRMARTRHAPWTTARSAGGRSRAT